MLAVGIVLVAAAVGIYFGIPVYRQQTMIQEIERLGGWVGAREGGPEWLREKLGHERMKGFDEIRAVSVGGTEFDDTSLARLRHLNRLVWLNLDRTPISDAGLANLQSMTRLETLRLNETRVTDAGLAHLKSMTSLLHLDLSGTQVTDVGVGELKQALPRLQIRR